MLQASFNTVKVSQQSRWINYSTDSAWIFVSKFGEVVLSRREQYPATFAFSDGALLYIGYGSAAYATELAKQDLHFIPNEQFYDDEFLLIIADASTGRVVVQRDAFITLPIFYSFQGGWLRLSNDYAWTARHMPKRTVSRLSLADGLIVLPFNWQDTISELGVLTERSRLVLEKTGGVRVELPSPRARSHKTDPHAFKDVLEQTLDAYWQRYGSQTLMFELSGGIDSSIAPGYFSRRYGLQPLCVTKLFPFDFYHSQSQKIADFAQAFSAYTATIPIELARHYPLRYALEGGYAAPLYRFAEIYRSINTEMAKHATLSGVTAVFTGIGGNELFERGRWAQQSFAGEAEKKRRQGLAIPFFYTQRFKDLYHRSIADVPATGIPVPLLASSALHAGTARNNIYLERGVWPVSPLAHPRLFAYAQGLDVRFKDNKNIMRAYASAAGYPESIFNPTLNEHAGPFFDEGVLTYFPRTAHSLIENSVLAAHELVDIPALLSVYGKVRSKEISERALFDLYNFIVLEHNLQAMKPELALEA